MGEGSPRNFNYHENLTSTKILTPRTLTHETKRVCEGFSSTRWHFVCMHTGHRYFWNAIIKVQACGQPVANFLVVQICAGLIFVSVACTQELVPHEKFLHYSSYMYMHACKHARIYTCINIYTMVSLCWFCLLNVGWKLCCQEKLSLLLPLLKYDLCRLLVCRRC